MLRMSSTLLLAAGLLLIGVSLVGAEPGPGAESLDAPHPAYPGPHEPDHPDFAHPGLRKPLVPGETLLLRSFAKAGCRNDDRTDLDGNLHCLGPGGLTFTRTYGDEREGFDLYLDGRLVASEPPGVGLDGPYVVPPFTFERLPSGTMEVRWARHRLTMGHTIVPLAPGVRRILPDGRSCDAIIKSSDPDASPDCAALVEEEPDTGKQVDGERWVASAIDDATCRLVEPASVEDRAAWAKDAVRDDAFEDCDAPRFTDLTILRLDGHEHVFPIGHGSAGYDWEKERPPYAAPALAATMPEGATSDIVGRARWRFAADPDDEDAPAEPRAALFERRIVTPTGSTGRFELYALGGDNACLASLHTTLHEAQAAAERLESGETPCKTDR